MDNTDTIWIYLSTSPLLGLTMTLVAYQGGLWIYQKSGLNPLLNPVLIAVSVLVGTLMVTGIPYETYFEGGRFIHFLLGPATVALAVPLYQNIQKIHQSFIPVVGAIFMGSLTAVFSSMGLAWGLGASKQTVLSLAPKSVTTPIAMGISDVIGGVPSLTAALVILTGIIGAALGPFVLNALNIKDWQARGLAMGTASHGIGTARALQVNALAGAFSSLAMGLNGLLTAVFLPIVIEWLW